MKYRIIRTILIKNILNFTAFCVSRSIKTVPGIIHFKKLANEKTVFNGGCHHDVVLFGC